MLLFSSPPSVFVFGVWATPFGVDGGGLTENSISNALERNVFAIYQNYPWIVFGHQWVSSGKQSLHIFVWKVHLIVYGLENIPVVVVFVLVPLKTWDSGEPGAKTKPISTHQNNVMYQTDNWRTTLPYAGNDKLICLPGQSEMFGARLQRFGICKASVLLRGSGVTELSLTLSNMQRQVGCSS